MPPHLQGLLREILERERELEAVADLGDAAAAAGPDHRDAAVAAAATAAELGRLHAALAAIDLDSFQALAIVKDTGLAQMKAARKRFPRPAAAARRRLCSAAAVPGVMSQIYQECDKRAQQPTVAAVRATRALLLLQLSDLAVGNERHNLQRAARPLILEASL